MQYDLTNIRNPHICAALLKEWMRLLSEPVIPTDALYAQAIASVKTSSGASYDADAIRKLYTELPPLNQRVLKELAIMVRDISEPSNADKSKMTVDNQAIVWAPSFLRNPSIDPQELMVSPSSEGTPTGMRLCCGWNRLLMDVCVWTICFGSLRRFLHHHQQLNTKASHTQTRIFTRPGTPVTVASSKLNACLFVALFAV